MLRRTWPDLYTAVRAARYEAEADGVRQRVIRENGHDEWGAYRFRSLPADACSCFTWTESVGPGLNLQCAEQHHTCPVHPLVPAEVAEPCS